MPCFDRHKEAKIGQPSLMFRKKISESGCRVSALREKPAGSPTQDGQTLAVQQRVINSCEIVKQLII